MFFLIPSFAVDRFFGKFDSEKRNIFFEKKCRKSREFKIKYVLEKLFDTELYETAIYYSATFILRNFSNANTSLSSDKQSKLTTYLQEAKRQDTFCTFLCIKFPYQASNGFTFFNTLRL